MAQPQDPIQDELEYSEQTVFLQQHYAPSLADVQSLQSIRMRLLLQRSQQKMNDQNEPMAQPTSGQFFIPSTPSSTVRDRKSLRPWNLVALACLLCAVVLASTWYALLHQPPLHQSRKTIVPQPGIAHLSSPFYVLQMTSPLVGWGLTAGLGEASKDTVMHTTDGGRSWHAVYTTNPNQMLNFLGGRFFLNDQVAWLSLGSLTGFGPSTTTIHTTDGGAHWTHLQLPAHIFNYTFIDQQHGWAWTEGLTPMDLIYKTDDGGKSWRKITTPDAARVPSDETESNLPAFSGLDIAFVTLQHGWLIVYNHRFNQGVEYLYAALYTTYDGGQSWQVQTLPQPASGPIPGIDAPLVGASWTGNQSTGSIDMSPPHFFNAQQGIISISSQINDNGPSKIYLYTTNDGGQHWSPEGAPISIAGTNSGMEPLDENHIYIISRNSTGSNSTLANYTFMQGQWQKTDTSFLEEQQSNLTLPTFADSRHGWVSLNKQTDKNTFTTLYATDDGGKSWSAVMKSTISNPQKKQGG